MFSFLESLQCKQFCKMVILFHLPNPFPFFLFFTNLDKRNKISLRKIISYYRDRFPKLEITLKTNSISYHFSRIFGKTFHFQTIRNLHIIEKKYLVTTSF